mmetsp:Transcript_34714/g.25855  ORF Transcript_34714/g.25855 Transcript_34714/m.25855 type:complete len:175 (+) Transcript_34714:964-1488(+)
MSARQSVPYKAVVDDNYIAGAAAVNKIERSNSDLAGVGDFELLKKETLSSDRQILCTQIRKLLNSELISLEEKGYLIQLMHDHRLRPVLSELLGEANSSRPLKNFDCLKLLSDLIKFVLTLFVHEGNVDFKMLYMILESSQHVHYIHNNRKTFLAGLLCDHGIWQDANIWKECI